jgi:hypothetical protein
VNTQATRRLVGVIVIAGVLGLVPTAAGGGSALCPESAGPPCREIGSRPDADRTQVRPLPQSVKGPNGQQMWRSGKWLMS